MSKVAKIKTINQQIVTKLDVMKVENEKFETNELSRSNKTLYSLLGQVYEVFNSVDKKDLETPRYLKSVLKQRGVKVQDNTPFLTVLIRYVFNSDRSKSFNYNRVISSAIQKGISPNDLPSHIQEMGGIEECKRDYIPSQETIDKKQKLKDSLESTEHKFLELSSFHTQKMTNEIKKVEGCQFVFTVGRLGDDGKTIELISVLNQMNKAMEKTALKILSKQLK
jgi:hypothetical protein